MCGIAGVLGSSSAWMANSRAVVKRMCSLIVHRGPDDSGEWVDDDACIALGHRRLSIIDLSSQGHQPMSSACGRYVVVFNGEIYNHNELRERIGSHSWRGHSDTETVLECFSRFGVVESLPLLVGMFAIAVWDRSRRQLTLVRDRMGEKPLYFGRLQGGQFLFSSELRALAAHPEWRGEVDRNALGQFLRYNYVPAPMSIYKGISKLLPGCWLSISSAGAEQQGSYWGPQTFARQQKGADSLSDDVAVSRLEDVLGVAVKSQLMSDVPLGAFLSGGVDSSTVVALMCKYSSRTVRTFSIGFHEEEFNEAEHAGAVARHLGTEHTALYVTAAEALAVVPQLPDIYDEPFADSSQIPTFLVARLARRDVTVALSGDGGDELFAGYNRYRLARGLWRGLNSIPLGLRRSAGNTILRVAPETIDRTCGPLLRLLPNRFRYGDVGDKVHKFAANVLPASSLREMYLALVSHWKDPAEVVVGGSVAVLGGLNANVWEACTTDIDAMCLADQLTYLPDDILAKVDRAAMAVSLETRVPLLDHRVVEFAWRTPLNQKMRGGVTKWLLRQVLYRHVPQELIDRPKQGFAVPLAAWLRGPLRDWGEDLLSESDLSQGGYLDPKVVRQYWLEHQSGRRNWQYRLWNVLMFQAWLRRMRSGWR